MGGTVSLALMELDNLSYGEGGEWWGKRTVGARVWAREK